MKTRLAVHWSERTRVILFLLVYTALAEYTAPTPFIQSRFGMLTYFLIVLYVFKEVWRYREENSPRSHKRAERIRGRLTLRRSRLTDYTKYRIQRIARFVFIVYSMGWLIDGLTDRCTGALQCGYTLPQLIVQNLPEILMFAVRLAMSMASLFMMMYVMAKMDLFTTILPDSIETRFKDVYGQDKAVKRVKENLQMLDRPDIIESKGGYMPGGILLTGPPGTGKTMIAEAFAGETGKPFIFVGPGSFSAMFVGVPIMKVKMLFRHLRKMSVKYGGVVCFLDEIDSLGNRGATVGDQGDPLMDLTCFNEDVVTHHEPNGLLNKMNINMGGSGGGALEAFLAEMSGISKPKGLYNKIRVMAGFKPVPPPKYRILFLGATNLAERLDPALLRPGRFDRQLKVGYPDQNGRVATLEGYLNKVDHNLTDEEITRLAKENPKATGASVKDLVNEALIAADGDGRDTITYIDVRDAAIWKMLGEDNGTHSHPDDNRLVELHEAAHAVASHYFRKRSDIQFASVHKRGRTGGVVSAVPKEERMGHTKSEMEAHVKVALASRWAEIYFFDGDLTTGPSSDVEKATEMVANMIIKYTMGEFVSVFPSGDGLLHALPDGVQRSVYESVQRLYDEMVAFMEEHIEQVEAVADLLHEFGTVDGTAIHQLIERMDA